MSIAVRHPAMDELESAAAVLNAHSGALYGTDDTSPAELEVAWRAPEVEFPADIFVADRGDELVGYADVIPFGRTAWIDVRATDAAAYEPLLEASIRRAETHPTPHIRAFASDQDQAAQEALERVGFEPIRHGFRMMIDLDGELPEPHWPEGFAVRRFREGDEGRFHRGHQESFADTWEFTPEPFDNWSHWFMGPATFEPEHWFIVEHGEELAAVAICRISETEDNAGWVFILGVLPAYRRRGLAMALLQHLFRHFAGAGMKRVGLGVDAENPTGAVALYERAGMYVARRNLTYERVPR
jgi:mycothiol synthase